MELFSFSTLLDDLATMELLMGMFLIGAGLVFTLMGFRIFQFLVVVSFGFIGFLIGGNLQVDPVMQMIFSLLGAAGLSIFSYCMMKTAVAVLAGGWCGLAVLVAMANMGMDERTILLIAICAFAIGLSLTFIMYKEIIAFVTSLEGTLLFLAGMVILLSQQVSWWFYIRELLIDTPVFAPFLIIAGTVTGFYLQLTELRQKNTGISG